MADYSVHKASDLPRDERLLVERWLGRALFDDESVSLAAYRPHAEPSSDERERLRREIVNQAREIASRGEHANPDEVHISK